MEKTHNHQEKKEQRILGRTLARELSRDELELASGGAGTTSCSACQPDDCDVQEY